MRDTIAAAGAALAAVFVSAPAHGAARYNPAPTAMDAVSGPGRCVIILGADNERPCARVHVTGPYTRMHVEVEADGGHVGFDGAIGGEMGDFDIDTLDYAGARRARAQGACELLFTSDGKGLVNVSCDSTSAWGEIRVRYVAAP
jgi:hypothetical protein